MDVGKRTRVYATCTGAPTDFGFLSRGSLCFFFPPYLQHALQVFPRNVPSLGARFRREWNDVSGTYMRCTGPCVSVYYSSYSWACVNTVDNYLIVADDALLSQLFSLGWEQVLLARVE